MTDEKRSEMAEFLSRIYRHWAGNMGYGGHLPETWNAVAKGAIEFMSSYYNGSQEREWPGSEQRARSGGGMKDLTYREFLDTVRLASGTFSYVCLGSRGTCNPTVYVARNWPKGLPK